MSSVGSAGYVSSADFHRRIDWLGMTFARLRLTAARTVLLTSYSLHTSGHVFPW